MTCANQVRAAIDSVLREATPFPTSWDEAQTRHQLLYGADARDRQHES
jgi:hypothetical protein